MTEIIAAHLERVASDLEKQLDAIVAEHFAHWVDEDDDDDDAPIYLQCACGKRFHGNKQHTDHANEARRIVLAAALAACARESRKEAFEEAAKVVDGLQTSAVRNRMAKLIRERAAGESSLAPQGGQHDT